MLEEMWHDRVQIPAEELEAQEREMKEKKAAVVQLKKANQQRRDGIHQQASALDAGFAKLHEREASLAAALQKATAANAEADELKAKTATHASAAQRAREQMADADAALSTNKAECDSLTQRLATLHRQAAEETQRAAALQAEGNGVAARLAQMKAQREAAAAAAAECVGWYDSVNSVVKTFAGISRVTSDGHTMRYDLEAGVPGGASAALIVQLDAASGALAGAHLEPAGLAHITDVVDASVRLNALELLIREVQVRLLPAAAAPPSTALVPAGPPATRPRGGLASTPGKYRGKAVAADALPTPAAASGASAALPMLTGGSAQHAVPPPSREPGMWSTAGKGAGGSVPPPSATDLASGPAPTHPPAAAPAAPPAAMPVENLSARMSMASTPGASAPVGARVTRSSVGGLAFGIHPSAGTQSELLPDTEPRSQYQAGRAPMADAAPPPAGSSSSSHMPPSAAGATSTALALPIRLESVDPMMIDDIGSARHDASSWRKSRKSFTRSVSHPRSPCSIAAKQGFVIDPRAVISEVAAGDGVGGAPTREFVVKDALGTVRASLLSDGSVVDRTGELLAYIEADGTVGAPDLAYLGEVTAPNGNSTGYVTGKDDALVAEVDYGLGVIRDATGSTIASLTRAGEVSGHYGARAGTLEGFSFAMLRSAAAYLTLVDAQFVQGK